MIENEEVMKEKLYEFAKKHNFENYSVNVYKSILPDEGVINFAEELEADMIALAYSWKKRYSSLVYREFSGRYCEPNTATSLDT